MFPLFKANPVDTFILLLAYVIWLAPEMLRSRSRRPAPGARKNDRLSGLVLSAGIWTGVVGENIVALTLPRFAIPWDRMLLFGSGIFLMLAGVAFRGYSIRVLGRYFSVVVAVQVGQTVIERGPYRLIRHPSYSGALLTLLGLGLASGNWLSLLIVLVFPILGYSYRMWVEERTLVEGLGEPYRQYMQRTKRIIPFVI